jgi:hypothetical protein
MVGGRRGSWEQYSSKQFPVRTRLLLEPPPDLWIMLALTMKTTSIPSPVTRRTFLKSGAVATAGLATLSLGARAQTNKNSKLRIFQIGVGGIGGMQRGGLRGHPNVEWAGFCDVDRRELEKIQKEHPDAWVTKDYREAFANRVGDFDAVICDVPPRPAHRPPRAPRASRS